MATETDTRRTTTAPGAVGSGRRVRFEQVPDDAVGAGSDSVGAHCPASEKFAEEAAQLDSLATRWRASQAALAKHEAESADILASTVELAYLLSEDGHDPKVALRSYAAELATVARVSDRTMLTRMLESHLGAE